MTQLLNSITPSETQSEFGKATIQAAKARLVASIDAETRNVPAYLPVEIADALLVKAGWTIDIRKTAARHVRKGYPESYPVFWPPNHQEQPDSSPVVERDEALRIALFQLAETTITPGDYVMHHSEKTGDEVEWEVLRVEADGTLSLEDEDGGTAYGVNPADVRVVEASDHDCGEHYARTDSGELIGPYDTVDECERERLAANAEFHAEDAD